MLKKMSFLLLLITLIAAVPMHFESRFAGVVADYKIFSIDQEMNIVCYIKISDVKEYFIEGKDQIPTIYVGDSLYEYWINYQKLYVGTNKSINRYKILTKDR